MGMLRRDEPLTAATVRSYDRIPDRPTVNSVSDSELWRIYRCVPEVHYAVTQQARLVGRLEWRIEIDSTEVEEGDEILRQAFGSDLRSIVVMAAIHLQVVGRFFLVRIPARQGSERRDPEWRILASPVPSQQKDFYEAADIVVECVMEDPVIPGRADSPVRAIRDLATELILTRSQARAAARNRTAQLMTVLYPKEGAGPNPKKFEKDWAKVVADPLADEKSSAVVVPNLIGWPAEYIDKWQTLDLTGPLDEKLHERVDRLIRQIAIGLDIAPTVLLGLADSTQWTANSSQEDNWLGHVEPLAASVGQTLAEGLSKASRQEQNRSRIEVIPDPAPLLRRRPAVADVLTAWRDGLINGEWAREQIGAPEDAAGPGIPEPTEEVVTVERETDGTEPVIEESEQRAITQQTAEQPRAAANGTPEIDGARLAEIDEQAYTSMQDLIIDTTERALEKLGARIRSIAQGRNIDLPAEASNIEIARLYTGEVPNGDSIINEVAQAAAAKVLRIIERAQGRLRAMGVEVESQPEDPQVTAAQAAFVAAVVGTVAVQQEGGTGIAEAWEAARQAVTIAGGGSAADFQQAASGIALAASTMAIIRRDMGLAPPTGPRSHRWLHLYQGPEPHPVHLSLADALFNGVSVFAGGYEAFPGDHAGCQCIAVPARLVNVRTGWSQIQPSQSGGTP